MTREIKFRAWHEHSMYYDAWPASSDVFITEGGLEGSVTELMQFTGFKDKNGKDVYEGDILKEWHHLPDGTTTPDSYTLQVVEFGEKGIDWEMLGWMTRYIKAIGPDGKEENGRFSQYMPLHWMFDDENDMEVVGNRFETPELMKMGNWRPSR